MDRLSDMGKRSVLNYAAETQRMELKDSQVSSPVCCYKHVVELNGMNLNNSTLFMSKHNVTSFPVSVCNYICIYRCRTGFIY